MYFSQRNSIGYLYSLLFKCVHFETPSSILKMCDTAQKTIEAQNKMCFFNLLCENVPILLKQTIRSRLLCFLKKRQDYL